MPDNSLATEYWSWVRRLGEWHFSPENEGRQVRLHWPLDEDFSGQEENFVHVLRNWNLRDSIIDVALGLSLFWNPDDGTFRPSHYPPGMAPGNNCKYPPYLPYLVCFSMAWGEEGTYSQNAYYERLNDLLQLSQGDRINTPQFKYVDRLWEDLEVWANVTKGGELGLFSAVSAGHMVHIGYPLSQVVLSPSERKNLRDIFCREGWTAEMSLTESEINDVLSEYKEQFRGRTQAGIDRKNSNFLHALHEEIRIELASFSPAPDERSTSGGSGSGGSGTGHNRLRLVCQMGLHSVERWTFTLFREVSDFQEVSQEEFTLRPGQSAGVLWQRTTNGDSCDPLCFEDFSLLGQELRLTGSGKRFLWPGRDVRFFAPSKQRDGLFLEQELLPEVGPVVILLANSDIGKIEQIDHQELTGKVPHGCKLLRSNDVENLNRLFPGQRLRARHCNPISFTGGIRLSPWAETYFAYALPHVFTSPGWSLGTGTPNVSLEDVEGGELKSIKVNVDSIPNEAVIHAFDERGRCRRRRIGLVWHPPAVEPSSLDDKTITYPDDRETGGFNKEEWSFPVWPDGLQSSGKDFWENPTLQAWEIISTWGHFSYAKFRDAIHSLCETRTQKPSRIAACFQALGHADIDSSPSNGHWNGVRMSRGHMYRLPWNAIRDKTEYVQMVLAGPLQWRQLMDVLNDLPAGVGYDIREQSNLCAPPRIRFWAPEEKLLISLAERLDVQWKDWEQNQRIPSIGGFLAYMEGQDWIEGVMSAGESMAFFSPYHLKDYKCNNQRYERLTRTCGQFLLASQEQTYGLSEFYLLDTFRNRRIRLPFGQRQWGRWLSYLDTAKKFYKNLFRSNKEHQREVQVAIPHDCQKGLLAFPAALRPPMEIEKLLCSCSGLVPTYSPWEYVCPTLNGLDYECVEAFESPVLFPAKSTAIVYEKIPGPVASLVASKLGVIISNIELHCGRERQ